MSSAKRTLTERLENMSFMRRGQERERRESYAKRQRQREDDAHWVLPAPPPPKAALEVPTVIVETGYVVEPGALGRQSFGSFNPVVEKRNAAIEQGLDPNAPPPPPSAPLGNAPTPMLRGADPETGFIEPFLAAPKDEPAPRPKSTAPPTSGKKRKEQKKEPQVLISKRKHKGGMVDESGLKKKRRKRNKSQ